MVNQALEKIKNGGLGRRLRAHTFVDKFFSSSFASDLAKIPQAYLEVWIHTMCSVSYNTSNVRMGVIIHFGAIVNALRQQ